MGIIDLALRLSVSLLAGVLLMAGVCPANGHDLDHVPKFKTEKEILVPMRDGARLSTDVTLPAHTTGRLATVLIRTPYRKESTEWALMRPFLEMYLDHGYAVVMQNERGFFLSEGTFYNYLEGASTDGYDTVEWIIKQPWSNGKVGTIGSSSSAETQWPMAASNHPAHAAMIPMAAGVAIGNIPGNDTRGAIYRGGVPVLSAWLWWYAYTVQSERLNFPRETSQQERVAWQKRYAHPIYKFPVPMSAITDFSGTGDQRVLLHLPSKDIMRALGAGPTPYDKYLTWTPADPRWRNVEQIGRYAKPRVPALHVDTWYDGLGLVETTRLFKYLQDIGTPNQYLIVGAGQHSEVILEELRQSVNFESLKEAASENPDLKVSNVVSGRKFGDFGFDDLEIGDARYGGADHGFANLFLNWFDYWLKGASNRATEMPKVQLFVMGKGWISSNRWPPEETQFTSYFLGRRPGASSSATRTLSLEKISNRGGAESYIYDPASPTPTRGGGCCWPSALDQRPVEARKDVLSYSTQPLEKPLTIVGPVEVVLYVSSSAKDTDFMVKLVDVYPDGKAINLSDDAFRMRYRGGYEKKALMRRGEVYEIKLTNMVTAIQFEKGHKIRLDVSSSNFPLYERNLNTGGNNYDEVAWVTAENSIHFGGAYPSRVVLPVLPNH